MKTIKAWWLLVICTLCGFSNVFAQTYPLAGVKAANSDPTAGNYSTYSFQFDPNGESTQIFDVIIIDFPKPPTGDNFDVSGASILTEAVTGQLIIIHAGPSLIDPDRQELQLMRVNGPLPADPALEMTSNHVFEITGIKNTSYATNDYFRVDIKVLRSEYGLDPLGPNQSDPPFNILAGGPDHIRFVMEPADSVAGQNIVGPPKVQLFDKFDNLIKNAGFPVTIEPVDPVAMGTLTGTTTKSTQGAPEYAAVFDNIQFTKASAYAGGVWIQDKQLIAKQNLRTATSTAFSVSSDVAYSVVMDAPSPATITASDPLSPEVVQSTLGATVKDQFDNVCPDIPVTWSASVSETITDAVSPTGANGKTSALVSSTKRGVATIVCTVTGSSPTVSGSVDIAVNAAEPFSISGSASPTSIMASSGSIQSTVTGTVKDAFDNVVPGVTVDWTTASPGVVTPASSVTAGAAGSESASTAFSSTLAGDATVTGTVNGTSISFNVTITVTHADPDHVRTDNISANPVSIIASDGSDPAKRSVVKAQVVDEFNNPCPGASVTFSTTHPDSILTGSPWVTGSDGFATTEFSSQKTGTAPITATFASTTASVNVQVTADQGTVTLVQAAPTTIGASDGTDPANQSTITATVLDQFNNPCPGVTVLFATTPITGVVNPASAATDMNGLATTKFSSPTMGMATITARTASQTTPASCEVEVTHGPPSPDTSTLVGNPNPQTVGRVMNLTATIKDKFGNVIEGVTVTFSAANGTVNPATDVTDVEGKAHSSVTTTVSGPNVCKATVLNVEVLGTMNFLPEMPHHYLVTFNSGVTGDAPFDVPANGIVEVQAQLQDMYSNNIGGFAASGLGSKTVNWSAETTGAFQPSGNPEEYGWPVFPDGHAVIDFKVGKVGQFHVITVEDGDGIIGYSPMLIIDRDGDADGDGYSNWAELYVATDPLDSADRMDFTDIYTDKPVNKQNAYFGFQTAGSYTPRIFRLLFGLQFTNVVVTNQIQIKDDYYTDWTDVGTALSWGQQVWYYDPDATANLWRRYYRVQVIGVLHAAVPAPPTPVTCDPVGFEWKELMVGGNPMSLPLHRIAEYRGLVKSVSGNKVTMKGSPAWSPGYLGPQDGWNQYYLIVRKGANEGDWWEITGNTTDSVNVDVTGGHALTLAPDDQIEIRPMDTMQEIFGSGLENSEYDLVLTKDDGTGKVGDMVYYSSGLTFTGTAFYFDDGTGLGNGWYVQQYGPFGGATLTFKPDQTLLVQIPVTGTPKWVIQLGKVQKSKFSHYLFNTSGYSSVGNPFPVAAPVSTSGLRESTGGWRDFTNTTNPVSIDDCDLGYDSEGNAFPGPFYYVNFPDPYNITGWWFGVTPNDYQFLPWKAWFIYKEGPGVWRQAVPPTVP